MVNVTDTPLADLASEGRLLSPVFKGPTTRPDRFGFRGEIALQFAKQLSDEARPPQVRFDQVMTIASSSDTTIPFLAGVALSLGHLELLCQVLKGKLATAGKYFFFANNLDITKRFRIDFDGVPFWVLPLDEATVYNELLDLFGIERGDLKKLDTAGKLDAIADAAADFNATFPAISYDEATKIMGPIKIPENRPV